MRRRLDTVLRMVAQGVPLSLAKDQVMRDAVVMMPVAHAQVKARTTAPIAVAPAVDLTLSVETLGGQETMNRGQESRNLLLKIWINGYPVAVSSTESTSPRQNNIVSIIVKPTNPLMSMLQRMARGMFTAALSTSSAR